MPHDSKLVVYLFGVLLLFSAPGYAQEKKVDTTRLPQNLSDCLFRGWPRAGEWVTHAVTLDRSFAENSNKAAQRMSFIMRAAMIPIEDGDGLEWFEVSLRRKLGEPPIYIAKLLVDRKKARPGEWLLARQACTGWEKRGTNDAVRFTEETIHKTTLLQSLIVSGEPDAKWEKCPAADVQTVAGKFRCNGFRLRSKSPNEEGGFVCRLHPSIPFGCVLLKGELRMGEETAHVRVQLSGHGNGARSHLAEKDLIGLVEIPGESTEKAANSK